MPPCVEGDRLKSHRWLDTEASRIPCICAWMGTQDPEVLQLSSFDNVLDKVLQRIAVVTRRNM